MTSIAPYKIEALKASFSQVENDMTIREYVEMEAESDPNFFRFLFSTELEHDFDTSLTENQRDEYQQFLKGLPTIASK
jgi:hypothetical protein